MIAVSIKNLGFKYEKSDTWILKNISLDINKGEITVITGGNGSGKTTLLRCIRALIPNVYKGELVGNIRIFNQDLEEMNPLELVKTIGIVFQNPETQLFSSTVEDELVFGAENICLKRDEIHKRLNSILELTGIEHLRHSNPNNLSGGEQQLIAIAAVLMMDPEILLLDEVLSWVDKDNRSKILDILKSLKDKGKTIIMVDHIEENIRFADRILRI